MISLEVRNLDLDVLRRYLLTELSGTRHADGSVTGAGWRVAFVTLPDARVGRLAVPATRIDVDGDHEATVARFLALKSMRGGG